MVLKDEQAEYSLVPHLEVLEDPAGILTFDQISSPLYTAQFLPITQDDTNFGFSRSAIWLRVKIQNLARRDNWLLVIEEPRLGWVDFYRPSDNGKSFEHISTGAYRSFSSRGIPYLGYLFRLPVTGGNEETFYLRLQTDSVMLISTRVLSWEAFQAQSFSLYLFYGLVYGAFVILVIYQLYRFITLRSKSFLFLLLFMLITLFNLARLDGIGRQFLWPVLPPICFSLGAGLFGDILELGFAVAAGQRRRWDPGQSNHHWRDRFWLILAVFCLIGYEIGLFQVRVLIHALILACLLLLSITHRKDLSEPFSAAENEVQRLNRLAAEAAVSEERQRLARDLHDSVAQLIYGIRFLCSGLKKQALEGNLVDPAAQLQQIEDLGLRAIREIRLLIYQLRPSILGEAGLAGALQQRLELVEHHGDVVTELQVGGDLPVLTKDVEQQVFNIAQEALNNALHHSQASSICVDIFVVSGTLTLIIRDNGVGFDLDHFTAGIGLQSMHERAEEIAAQLQISSTPREGTMIRLELAV